MPLPTLSPSGDKLSGTLEKLEGHRGTLSSISPIRRRWTQKWVECDKAKLSYYVTPGVPPDGAVARKSIAIKGCNIKLDDAEYMIEVSSEANVDYVISFRATISKDYSAWAKFLSTSGANVSRKSSGSKGNFSSASTGGAERNETSFQSRLFAFYMEKNPDKVREVPMMLERYKGREEELLSVLVLKYGETAAEKGTHVAKSMLAATAKVEEEKQNTKRRALEREAERMRKERERRRAKEAKTTEAEIALKRAEEARALAEKKANAEMLRLKSIEAAAIEAARKLELSEQEEEQAQMEKKWQADRDKEKQEKEAKKTASFDEQLQQQLVEEATVNDKEPLSSSQALAGFSLPWFDQSTPEAAESDVTQNKEGISYPAALSTPTGFSIPFLNQKAEEAPNSTEATNASESTDSPEKSPLISSPSPLQPTPEKDINTGKSGNAAEDIGSNDIESNNEEPASPLSPQPEASPSSDKRGIEVSTVPENVQNTEIASQPPMPNAKVTEVPNTPEKVANSEVKAQAILPSPPPPPSESDTSSGKAPDAPENAESNKEATTSNPPAAPQHASEFDTKTFKPPDRQQKVESDVEKAKGSLPAPLSLRDDAVETQNVTESVNHVVTPPSKTVSSLQPDTKNTREVTDTERRAGVPEEKPERGDSVTAEAPENASLATTSVEAVEKKTTTDTTAAMGETQVANATESPVPRTPLKPTDTKISDSVAASHTEVLKKARELSSKKKKGKPLAGVPPPPPRHQPMVAPAESDSLFCGIFSCT